MSVLGDQIQELRGELDRARRRGDSARIMELSTKIEKLDEELKKQKQQIEQFGTITPVNMPKHINVSAIPQEQEKADRKAVRELFWGSNQLDSEAPEKKKSFTR